MPRAYEFEDFQIDVQRRALLKHGQLVPIKPRALDILLLLVEHHGQLLEKDTLMRRLWPDRFVEEANLTQNVFVARKALGDHPGDQRFIATVARHGYRFVGDVREVFDVPARLSAPQAEDAALTSGADPPRHWRLVAPAVGAALVLAGAVVTMAFRWGEHHPVSLKGEGWRR